MDAFAESDSFPNLQESFVNRTIESLWSYKNETMLGLSVFPVHNNRKQLQGKNNLRLFSLLA